MRHLKVNKKPRGAVLRRFGRQENVALQRCDLKGGDGNHSCDGEGAQALV